MALKRPEYWFKKDGKKIDPPEFDGWIAAPRNHTVIEGGVFLMCPRGGYPPEYYGVGGLPSTNAYVGKKLETLDTSKCYVIYYPDKKQKFKGNPIYAAPLPLP